MLQDEAATGACDMWAVGCVIFQLLTGRSPFRTASEYLTFSAIQAHCDGTQPLQFPESITDSSKDIIAKLLVADVSSRLGFGTDDSATDITALRSHPFFESASMPIVWGHLLEQEAPYIPDPETFPSTADMRDGADDEWLSDGEATPIMVNPAAYKHRGSDDGSISSAKSVNPLNIGTCTFA